MTFIFPDDQEQIVYRNLIQNHEVIAQNTVPGGMNEQLIKY